MNESQTVSITEAGWDFLAMAYKADACRKVVVCKDDHPKYVVYAIDSVPLELTDDELIDVAAKRVLARYRKAFEELAK